jgi:putative colanic acid biosysnthesis UDP-glucose lipid carrier transferase
VDLIQNTLRLNYCEQPSRRLSPAIPGGILRRYSKDLSNIQKLSDVLISGISLWVASFVLGKPWGELQQIIAIISMLLIAIFAKRMGLYTSFRGDSHWSLLRRVLLLWLGLIGCVGVGLFMFKLGGRVSREQLFIWLFFYGIYLVVSHLCSRQLLRRLRLLGRNSRCDGFIGTEEGFERIQHQFTEASWLGHRVRPVLCWPGQLLPNKASIQQLKQRFDKQLPDQWLVEEPADPEILSELLCCLQDQPAPVLLLPRWLNDTQYKPRYCQLGTIGAIELWGHSEHATPLQLNAKYFCDWLLSGIIIVAISPLLLLIALAIKVESSGPILFRQRRYGLNGKPFDCFKFRTMNAQENGLHVVQATRNDPRVTKVGAILRSWNLDELPQLMNIWRGEMSLVGPRPHAEAHNEYYRTQVSAYMRRHGLRPGLTGWAQVQGLRGETDTIEKMTARVNADIDYIQNWNLMLDCKIFLLTFLRWRNKNAY